MQFRRYNEHSRAAASQLFQGNNINKSCFSNSSCYRLTQSGQTSHSIVRKTAVNRALIECGDASAISMQIQRALSEMDAPSGHLHRQPRAL